MSEEKKIPAEELQPENAMESPPAENQLPAPAEPLTLAVATPTAVSMWNDVKQMNMAFRTAKMLSGSTVVPELYRDSPQNCLIAIDLANRLGLPPITVMQNLYMVKGKPSWSGQFCIAAINGCGRFTPLDYIFVGEPGTPSYGCYVKAIRLSTGSVCTSTTITMEMVIKEGWYSKKDKYGNETSKWQTMPEQMMRYRAATFFARTYCPDIMQGIPTYEEVQDVKGYENTATITLDPKEA